MQGIAMCQSKYFSQFSWRNDGISSIIFYNTNTRYRFEKEQTT
ncbi:hypothetical protein HMPREF1985_00136 [Mitsuokella sp. oral taxon 131 str. W9106]|nr:hypothetical protein HMPREF1985_00136 [Mitsuokella sp. oral taxon 131 str. W9106]